jgi:hypothetical protein
VALSASEIGNDPQGTDWSQSADLRNIRGFVRERLTAKAQRLTPRPVSLELPDNYQQLVCHATIVAIGAT